MGVASREDDELACGALEDFILRSRWQGGKKVVANKWLPSTARISNLHSSLEMKNLLVPPQSARGRHGSSQKGRCSSTALISNLHSSLEIQKNFGPSPHKNQPHSMTPIQGKLGKSKMPFLRPTRRASEESPCLSNARVS